MKAGRAISNGVTHMGGYHGGWRGWAIVERRVHIYKNRCAADAGAPLLEDAADDATTTYTVPAAVGRARMVALFEGLEEKADGLGLVDLSVTATSLEDVFISVGEQVEGAAAPVEAETLVGGALLPSAPGEPVPAGRLVAAVVQFRLPAVQTDQSDLDSPLDSHTGSSK